MVFGTQAAFRRCAFLSCVVISLNNMLCSVEMPLKLGGFLEILTSFLLNKRRWLVKIASPVEEKQNKPESIAFFCLVFCLLGPLAELRLFLLYSYQVARQVIQFSLHTQTDQL